MSTPRFELHPTVRLAFNDARRVGCTQCAGEQLATVNFIDESGDREPLCPTCAKPIAEHAGVALPAGWKGQQ